jgi:hypothetical protein
MMMIWGLTSLGTVKSQIHFENDEFNGKTNKKFVKAKKKGSVFSRKEYLYLQMFEMILNHEKRPLEKT